MAAFRKLFCKRVCHNILPSALTFCPPILQSTIARISSWPCCPEAALQTHCHSFQNLGVGTWPPLLGDKQYNRFYYYSESEKPKYNVDVPSFIFGKILIGCPASLRNSNRSLAALITGALILTGTLVYEGPVLCSFHVFRPQTSSHFLLESTAKFDGFWTPFVKSDVATEYIPRTMRQAWNVLV